MFIKYLASIRNSVQFIRTGFAARAKPSSIAAGRLSLLPEPPFLCPVRESSPLKMRYTSESRDEGAAPLWRSTEAAARERTPKNCNKYTIFRGESYSKQARNTLYYGSRPRISLATPIQIGLVETLQGGIMPTEIPTSSSAFPKTNLTSPEHGTR